jgi:hypothetical protein
MSPVLISHRGNIDCDFNINENHPDYIQKAINLGYDVEIDVRKFNDKLYLGHDSPDYEISLNWLLERSSKLWVHTKNFDALSYLIDYDIRSFYHQKENHTIINKCNLIWSHELVEANEKSVIPLLSLKELNSFTYKKVYGICSDFISFFNKGSI